MAQTADQVVVEIRAVIDQYTQAIKKVADDTKRSMAAVEGAVTKAEATVTKASNNTAAAVEKSSGRRMKAAADAATSEQAAAERSARAISRTADITERSAARIEAASHRRQDVPTVGPEAATGSGTSPAQAAAASGRDMAAESEKKESVGASFVKEAAKGLPDLVKGLVEGQSALHLFMQQGAQLLPVFGIWGVVLGGVVGAIDAVAGGLGAYESAADRAKAAQHSFDDAMKATKGTFTDSEQAAVKYASTLSLVEAGQLHLAKASLSTALSDSNKAYQDSLINVRHDVESLSSDIDRSITESTFSVQDKLSTELQKFSDEWQKAIAIVNKENPSSDDFERLQILIEDLQKSASSLGFDFGDLGKSLLAAGLAARAHEGEVSLLSATQQRLNEIGTNWIAILRQLGLELPNATAQVATLSGALTTLAGAFGQAFARAQSAPQTAASYVAQLEAEAKALDGTRATQEKVDAKIGANAAATKAWSDEIRDSKNPLLALIEAGRAYGATLEINTKRQKAASEKAPSASGAKATVRQDNSLGRVTDEIKENQDLIRVYYQGQDARDAVIAQYEALRAARQLNIKEGSDEEKQFIASYEASAAQKRAGDQMLSDYARGAELAKSSMTAQEAYNASLADLDRLRDEGAINAETYHRQLMKLNADNNGYVEGIQAVGQAIQTGIEGATSFGDALVKVGLALAKLILQAAALGANGGGPLGKLFDSLLGTAGGLIGGLIGGGGIEPTNLPEGMSPTAFYTDPAGRAGGGQALPGQIYQVGETGREWFAPSVPGQVIPNSVIKNAASGGGGGSGPPIQFNISMAGANGDRTIAEIAAAAVKKGLQSVPEINRQHRIRFA